MPARAASCSRTLHLNSSSMPYGSSPRRDALLAPSVTRTGHRGIRPSAPRTTAASILDHLTERETRGAANKSPPAGATPNWRYSLYVGEGTIKTHVSQRARQSSASATASKQSSSPTRPDSSTQTTRNRRPTDQAAPRFRLRRAEPLAPRSYDDGPPKPRHRRSRRHRRLTPSPTPRRCPMYSASASTCVANSYLNPLPASTPLRPCGFDSRFQLPRPPMSPMSPMSWM